FGYILPNTFLMGHSYSILRKRICSTSKIIECVDLPQGVFEGVTVDNVLLFLEVSDDAQARSGNPIIINKLYPKSTKDRVGVRNWDDSFTLKQSHLSEDDQYKL